jgi:methionyl-tRNA formyltransferase
MGNKKIVLLASRGYSTNMVYNALEKTYGIVTVILEEKEPLKVFLKRRIKKLGIITVLGQIMFQLFIVKTLTLISKKRVDKIIEENELDITEIHQNKISAVTSINSPKTIEIIETLQPDLIVVNGTRIISKKVLNAVKCRLINTHVGITPAYRGVHGAYWALVNNDAKNAGVTVHFVDAGIDTGGIIAQANIQITKDDNFITYPVKQLAEGILILNKAISKYFDDSIIVEPEKGNSQLYYHPTIWQYLYNLIKKGVK